MRAVAIGLAALLWAGPAIAAEVGVGISAKSDDGLIYVPIDVSPKLRIEPHVRYSTDDSNSVETDPPTVNIVGQETESLEVGAGIFGVSRSGESLRVYYGGRVGYVYVRTVLNLDLIGGGTLRDTDTTDGFKIAPTFGFEYVFNSHFTLGGEVTYFFQRLEDGRTTERAHTEFVGERNGTESFLILRYFF